jgi:hypothetical protein
MLGAPALVTLRTPQVALALAQAAQGTPQCASVREVQERSRPHWKTPKVPMEVRNHTHQKQSTVARRPWRTEQPRRDHRLHISRTRCNKIQIVTEEEIKGAGGRKRGRACKRKTDSSKTTCRDIIIRLVMMSRQRYALCEEGYP